MVTRGKGGRSDWHIYTAIFKTDKLQNPTIAHRNYNQYFANYKGKESEKE